VIDNHQVYVWSYISWPHTLSLYHEICVF